MASKAFRAALAATKESKNVETVLVGGEYLGEGTHVVTIRSVDSSKIDEGVVGFTFVAEGGDKTYSENVFLMNQDGTEFGFSLRSLWSALIPDKEALAKFIDLASEDDKAFEVFTGMKLQITLEPGNGVQARATGDGQFAGYDVETNAPVEGCGPFADIDDVYKYVKANGLKRSYTRRKKTKCVAKDQNVLAFNTALANKANSGDTAVV